MIQFILGSIFYGCIICNLIQYQLSDFVILNSIDHNLKDNCGKYLLFVAKLTFVFINMYFVADICIYRYVSMLSDDLMNKESVSVYMSVKLNTQSQSHLCYHEYCLNEKATQTLRKLTLYTYHTV